MKATRLITSISLLPVFIVVVLLFFLLYQFRVIAGQEQKVRMADNILQSSNEVVYLTDRYLVSAEPAVWKRLTAKLAEAASLVKTAGPRTETGAAFIPRKLELEFDYIGKLLGRYNENNINLETDNTLLRQRLKILLEAAIIVKSRDIISAAQRFSNEKNISFDEASKHKATGILAALLFLSVVVPAATVPVAKRLSQSLTLLHGAISRSSGKELEVIDAPGRFEEFSAIAAAFNEMAERLKKSFSDLEQKRDELQKLNETLNSKVLERTKELSQANLLLDQMRKHSDAMSRSVRREAAKHHEEERRIHRLTESTGRILRQTELSEILKEVTYAAQDILDARYAVVGHGYFHEEIAAGRSGREACPLQGKFRMTRGGVYLEILRGGKPVRLTQQDLAAHPAWWGLPENHANLRGLLAVPLRDEQGKPFAVLMATDRYDGGDFTEEDEELLVHLASVASTTITLTRIKTACRTSGNDAADQEG